MTDRVRRLLAAQSAFVADASHQLRTPLTGLRLRLDEASAAGVSPSAQVELDAGVKEVERLAAVVDELLVLSGAGERETPGERLELEQLIDHTLERWQGAAVERGIELDRGPAVGGTIWCARADAERILDVLVENAIGYSPAGASVTLRSSGGSIEVRDHGPGLTDEDLATIFERFHRGSAGRASGAGSGLGLAIARELARGWDGEVTLANADGDGGGAIARLRLPPEPR
jgi:signal transduction histidine kinase